MDIEDKVIGFIGSVISCVTIKKKTQKENDSVIKIFIVFILEFIAVAAS